MSTTTVTELADLSLARAASRSTVGPTTSRTPRQDEVRLVRPQASALAIFLTVFQLCFINFLSSFTNGVINVGLPTIASSIDLERSLYLWPSSVYFLTSGSTLLLAGSISDHIGPRRVELIGCSLLGLFTLACGFANTGIQLVILRAFQGLALSMHLPASFALVAAAAPQGKVRNLSLSCLGLSQPLGFSAGLVISGFMIETAGWRLGFYLSGGGTLVAAVVGFWTLPKPLTNVPLMSASTLESLRTGIDWIGGVIGSAGLALLAYVLAIVSADLGAIHQTSTIITLTLSLLLLLAFPTWMHVRERRGKPTLIPNSLWKKLPFTSVCIMIALSNGVCNSMELFSSLYFQEIQQTTPVFTSLRLLPSLLVGTAINLTVGLFVHRVSARWLVSVSSLMCAVSTVMMALVNPAWNYWYLEFVAQLLAPTSADVLFTVGLLIVSDEFPEKTQSLAGAVFNTMAQFGASLAVGLCQVVALGVGGSAGETGDVLGIPRAQLLKGYQASFWTMFACMVACGTLAVSGLKKAGKVGVKRD